MAILQRYRKVRETDQEVEYIFGDPEMDRSLTIHKVERTYKVADGREDHATRAVLRGILNRATTENSWPGGGGVQH
jgi:hypothetical protein